MLQNLSILKGKLGGKFLLPNLLLCIIIFLLPFKTQIISFFIAALAVYTILIQFSKKLSTSKTKWKIPHFLILIFASYLIGVFVSEDQSSGWKEIEYRLSFLIIPFAFIGLSRKNIEIKYIAILKTFLLACFLSGLFSLIKSFNCINDIGEVWCNHYKYEGIFGKIYCFILYFKQEFIHCFFTSRIAFKMHTTYLSLYYVIAAFIGFVYLPSTKWKVFSGLYFLIFILLFNSLAIILSIIVMMMVFAVYYIWKINQINQIKYYLLAGIVGFALVISLVFKESIFINKSYQSFKEDKEAFYNQHKDDPGSIPARIIFWSVTLDLIKEKPWFGYGTGDAKNALIKEYENRGLDYIASRKFNPHNQFFQTTLYLGIFVGIAFFVFFILLLFQAIKTENLLFFVLIFQFFFNSLFESMLEGQAGIIFFTLFLFLLFDKKKITEQNLADTKH